MIKKYNTFINEIFTRPKVVDPKTPCVLFINGSRPWFNDKGALNINRRKQSTSNILSQFGDHLIYGDVYWRAGEMIFDDMMEIIENNNVVALVGNSAGGYVSFNLSNRYKIPALSINPAMASTSEAPVLQPLPEDVKNSPLFPKQLVIAGDKDTKANHGVDMHLVLEDLKKMRFEERGGEIMVLKDTYHRISNEQFNTAFRHFYKKYVEKKKEKYPGEKDEGNWGSPLFRGEKEEDGGDNWGSPLFRNKY